MARSSASSRSKERGRPGGRRTGAEESFIAIDTDSVDGSRQGVQYSVTIATKQGAAPLSLTDFRTLGRSGLVVGPLCMGTMTFGTPGRGAEEATSRALFDAYREAGGNFVDTADVYAGGESESMLGRFIRDTGARDELVLATKFGFNASANPNAGGCGAKNVHRALHASLRRLGTDHVDLYWMHAWDGVTPVGEIVETLGALVRAGRIRYYGLSDMPAWVATKAATLGAERGVPGPIAVQVEYSLVARDVEREHVPAALDAGMAVVPWSPLAGGFLTGKYARDGGAHAGRLGGPNPFGDSKFTERNWEVLDVLKRVAAEHERPPAQVALAWLAARPGVGSTLVGASRVSQLEDNLDAASADAPGFSDTLTSAPVRRMVFGGHAVTGWDER